MSRYDPNTRTWNGPCQPPVINPAASLGQVIVNMLERTPDHEFQICADTGEVYTCDKLRTRMTRVALNLASKCTITKGDIVCMVVNNSSSVTPVLFGCFLLGAPVHTLDASFGESDLVHLISITKPKLVFCNQRNLKTVNHSLNLANLQPQIIVLDSPEAEKLLFDPVEGEQAYRPIYLGDSNKTIAAIVCSSGTTGLPKAVCLTHAQLIAPYARVSHLGKDTLLCFSSLYWVSAFHMLLMALFNGGKRITTTKPFSPEYACELINKYKVSNIFTPPSILAEMVDYCEAQKVVLPSLNIVGCGGSCLPETLKQRANQLLKPHGKVYVCYAMSETGGIVSIDLFGVPNSAGVLMLNVTARIGNDDGDFLEAEQQGEIQVRYVHPFVGYYGNEQETRALHTADGFIKTGDIGFFDKAGFLYITDRKKEMLRYKGYQIAPAQLEALLTELAGISQAAVVGIPDSEPPHVDLATALVVKNQEELTEDQILDYINGKVANYKRLRGGVFFVESLPRTINGKVNRREAKQLALKLSQLNN